MLKRIALIVAGLALLSAVGFPLLASSTATTVANSFNVTTPGAGPVLTLNGQDTCQVTIAAPTQNISVTPQTSTDGVTWTPVSTIGYGSLSVAGTYVGAVSVSATSFRLFVAAAGSTGVVGNTVCSAGQPIPVFSPVGVVSGFGNLVCSGAVTCSPSAGPTPAVVGATPSPTASTGIAVSSTWPYIITNTKPVFPLLTAAGTAAAATYGCIVDTVTAGGASTAITFTTAFGTATASLDTIDNTAGTELASTVYSAVSKTGFTFTSTNAHVYYFQACGY